ncbi:aminoglycoside phosphotransferase family protein [Streptosporangium saharense]|uniref:Aminoglycoside phosphotransferase (APT) family kinase protein n=1 Tax=Streptosporangium saharense TaxID=1706840 RepID=A0A7W7QJP6_9ACTN|nr:aminoglycoside phosphotransferase family protein [Streptosporangium saharense]MBB4914857.1 aminoglycoside phosphotransferase (APT) family kinase protein [Streptosporangium saharense]
MNTPAMEVGIDGDLVDRLVRRQHPELAGPLTLVANGWDNVIYRLGTDLSVRLPRRRVAVDLIVNEQRWLPVLAGYVGVALPVPVRTGVPGEGYPWPWTIAPWFEGRTAAEVPPSDRSGIAVPLADFMTDLHRPAPPDAPRNPVRGVPLAARDEAVRRRLPSVSRSAELLPLWEELVALPDWRGPALWLHGDPHPGNLLLDGEDLAAVLDFGDLTGGDPATDLAAAWLVFDEDAREVFRSRVDADEVTWGRARGWALAVGTALAVHSADNPGMAAVGDHVLDQVLLP